MGLEQVDAELEQAAISKSYDKFSTKQSVRSQQVTQKFNRFVQHNAQQTKISDKVIEGDLQLQQRIIENKFIYKIKSKKNAFAFEKTWIAFDEKLHGP